MCMKYYRNATHLDMLRRDYQEEITRVNKMLEEEDDLKRRAILQEGLAENIRTCENGFSASF